MRLIVTDANIIIDLEAGQVLDPMFRLPGVEFQVPDILFHEELSARYPDLPAQGLRVVSQPEEATDMVERLRVEYRRASVIDLFALVMARRMGCALLSGDRALRAAATAQGVEVHGTIWLMARLLEARLVTVQQAEGAYRAMRLANSRLPWDEAERQLRIWRDA